MKYSSAILSYAKVGNAAIASAEQQVTDEAS